MGSTKDGPVLTPLAACLAGARQRMLDSDDPATRAAGRQVEVAAACKVAQSTVSEWEAGDSMPRLDRLVDVAAAYRVSARRLRSLWMQTASAAKAA